jgi:hypothetical protein
MTQAPESPQRRAAVRALGWAWFTFCGTVVATLTVRSLGLRRKQS